MLYNFGSINIDHIYRVAHFVRPGETLASSSYRQVLGGKGANQSLAVARAGGNVCHWGQLGNADRWVLEMLSAAGVDTTNVELIDGPSGHALIQVDDAGENAIILFPGANHGFDAARIETLIDQARPGDWLLLQNECNRLAEVMTQAHERGMVVAFNPAPMTAGVSELPLEACQLLFVNRGEAAALVELDEDTDRDVLLEALEHRLPEVELVLTLGSDGVCYQYRQQRLYLPAHRVAALDTTAAGDTFIGYFMAARQRGKEVEHCLRLASTASALCVQRAGAAPSIPVASDVEAAIRGWPELVMTSY
ncbi:ribokinase [Litchfieldella qijiaojingensis]|uniref:Ribokinase n=1 Tax=Litchfieldella qijiaojingensis TaxID=980347 RepID=A0ABQ2YD22_9GAMM|nr:ribokinase [Halomonas qijiaojingensis]GGX79338.1 ribokinase [Halomonas qijiaojingensis]